MSECPINIQALTIEIAGQTETDVYAHSLVIPHVVGRVSLRAGVPGEFPSIARLFVLPQFRLKRVASRLMGFCEQRVRQSGSKYLFLFVELENRGVLPFYEKRGYEVFRRRSDGFALRKNLTVGVQDEPS